MRLAGDVAALSWQPGGESRHAIRRAAAGEPLQHWRRGARALPRQWMGLSLSQTSVGAEVTGLRLRVRVTTADAGEAGTSCLRTPPSSHSVGLANRGAIVKILLARAPLLHATIGPPPGQVGVASGCCNVC